MHKEINTATTPLISVILPVYNGGHYLSLSISSIFNQQFQDFEFLILDDCSTDGSWDFIQQISDARVKIKRNDTNKGLFFNLNWLINNSTSQYIKLWSQDDIMYPDCLQKMFSFHQTYPDVGFSYSGRDIIDENGNIEQSADIDETPQLVTPELHARIAFFTGSIAGNISNVCLSKKALDKVGLFREDMKISADFDMWVRLAKDHMTGFIPDKLIQLRNHKGQLSRKESLYINHVREDLQVYRYLLTYVNPSIRKEGVMLLRKHKLVFYYTLMVKAFLKGDLKTAIAFYKEIAAFDKFLQLSISFIQAKISKPAKPSFV